jgi:hypothetical protein
MKNNLTEARFQFLAGVINENEFKQSEDIVSFLNNNFEEFIQKVTDPGSKFKSIGDSKVATAGNGDNGIDVSFDKEHMLNLFPEGDPYNKVEEIEIAGKKIYYNNYL